MPKLLSRAELARLGGRSAAAVTLACKEGGALAAAVVGKRVDLDHPATKKWLGNAASAPTEPPEDPETETSEATALDPVSAAELEELHSILTPLVARFGTSTAFRDYLDALKKIVDIREKDLKNDEARGRLISRELVQVHVFGAIEGTFRRLLTESTKTIARRVYSDAKAGRSVQEAEATVHDLISSQLKVMKAKVGKTLGE